MKHIVVDFTQLGEHCGFGEICNNFAPRLAALQLPDIRFTFRVKPPYIGSYGDRVEYMDFRQRDVGDIDLWHATDHRFDWWPADKNIQRLLTVHDLIFIHGNKGLKRLKYRFRLQHAARQADAVVCISDYVKEDLRATLRLKDKPLYRIYNAIPDMETAADQTPRFVTGQPFFFTIGQCRERKNFHSLIPMMKRFPDHHLYICGDSNSHYADRLRQLIARQQLNNVHLTGPVTNRERTWLYRHCEAFLFPSLMEGFGLPIIEALRFGCPIVAAASSCLPEIGKDHIAYFTDFQPESMSQTVRNTLKNNRAETEKSHIGHEDRRNYANTFNYDHYVQSYVELYRELLNNRTIKPKE